MDSMNFEIILNYGMDTSTIKPPSSFSSLMEISKEKYNLTIINRLVYYDNGAEVKIANDTDYLNLFDFMDASNLRQVEILIKSEECKSKRKKSTQLRKKSNSLKPSGTTGNGFHGSDDNCINDHFDNDYEGDLRNLKNGMEEGKWSKQSYNQGEQSRVFYIKQKKEMQKEEQVKRQAERLGNVHIEEEDDENNNKNRKKKALKSNSKENPIDDAEKEDDVSKNGKNFYKNKKK